MWYCISGLYTVIWVVSAILQPKPWDVEEEVEKLQKKKLEEVQAEIQAENANVNFTIKETVTSKENESNASISNRDKLMKGSDLKSPRKIGKRIQTIDEKIEEQETSIIADIKNNENGNIYRLNL